MNEGKSGWFSAKELAYLRDPESVHSKHRTTVRDRIEDKVNEEVIHDIERIPELLDFLESTTKESIRLQSEPTSVGRGLGQLYPEQLSELVFGLLLSERESDEPTEEFVERFDTIWEEIGADVRHRIQNSQQSFGVQRLFRDFRRDLLQKIINQVDIDHHLWDTRIRTPVDEFVEWIVDQKGESNLNHLPGILDTAFGITVDDPPLHRFVDYWNLLIQAAADSDINPPDDGGWDIDPKNPTEHDHELHKAALSALDDELRTAAHQFWDETQFPERDQLLALGLYTYSKLERRDKQILDRIPCSNRHDGWNRYDTRRANILSDDRDLPLLSRDTVPKRGADEKRYEFTAYGRFIYWLIPYVEDKGSYPAVLRDFLTDVPERLVDEANEWVTKYTGAARRLDLDVDELRGSTDDGDTGEFGPVLSNAMLWFRVDKGPCLITRQRRNRSPE